MIELNKHEEFNLTKRGGESSQFSFTLSVFSNAPIDQAQQSLMVVTLREGTDAPARAIREKDNDYVLDVGVLEETNSSGVVFYFGNLTPSEQQPLNELCLFVFSASNDVMAKFRIKAEDSKPNAVSYEIASLTKIGDYWKLKALGNASEYSVEDTLFNKGYN